MLLLYWCCSGGGITKYYLVLKTTFLRAIICLHLASVTILVASKVPTGMVQYQPRYQYLVVR